MFVTAVSVESLSAISGREGEDTVVRGLNEMLQDMQGRDVPGFKQALLLRGETGGAIVLAIWESERHAAEFLASDAGKNTARKQDQLFGPTAKRERFELTWQAKPGVGVE
jgi:heme-degrading monooxygenase HmoA